MCSVILSAFTISGALASMIFTDIVGYSAAICTTLAFLPQAIQIFRTKNTDSLSLIMYIVFTVGVLLWLCYGVLIQNKVVIFANTVTLIFALFILVTKITNELKAERWGA
jgi:MtN3 and saliva related transmembrane protein